MNFKDIAGQALRSLRRHRGRTILTVLGVIVGCCSVVIMISIGIGMRISGEATLEKMGDLTVIKVYASDDSSKMKLDDASVSAISSIKHVDAVVPRINYYGGITLYAGPGSRYKADYVSVIGEEIKLAAKEGYELSQGSYSDLEKGNALAGEYLAYAFQDTKRPEGLNRIERFNFYDWETDSYNELPDPYVDLNKEEITVVMGDAGDGGKCVTRKITVAGALKEDYSRGYETSEGLMIDMKLFREMLSEYAKLTGDKKLKEAGYSELTVKADSISSVEAIEKEIKKLGFRTSSMESIRKPMEQDMQQKQMLLGCVGAVSLFVAALGIANTMIMAITERIREIGVMKALGCFLKDIRKMFLFEAGCIGFIGGITGIALSYAVSMIMNGAGSGALFGNDYDYLIDQSQMALSVIPWWLAVFAVLFSVMVGVLAGLYPAEKAVRIPALDAIKHE